MTGTHADQVGRQRTAVVAHPGAQLYGSDRMVIESVTGLIGAGWRVVVTIPSDGPLAGELRSRGASVTICPTPVLRKSFLTPRGVVQLALLATVSAGRGARLLRRHRPDVVYVNTVTIPLWLLLARLFRVPCVCHVHEAEPTIPPLVRRALSLPLLLANRLIVISDYCIRVVSGDWPLLRPRMDLVYNGVTGPDVPPAPRASLTPPVRLLYVGRLSERKGVQDVVDALALLHKRGIDASLDLVGDVFTGYEWFHEDLIERASAAGTIDAMRFHGFDDDIWPYLADADILVAPSRLEPFGLVVVEGALAARPVVHARSGGMAEAAAASRAARAVEPESPDQIADAVESLVEQWDAVRAQVVEDVPVVRDRFSMERYRSAVSEVVAATAARRRR